MTPALSTLQNDDLRISVSDMGAELQTLTRSDGTELLWHGDGAWWGGRAPILFPIVGRAEHDRIAVGDFSAEMKQHGFARRALFRKVAQTPTSLRHELTDSPDTRAMFPFAFRLTLDHILSGPTLTVTARVENRDTRPMPFGLGFHPAFLWPLPGAKGKAHHITLDPPADPEMMRLHNGLSTNTRLPSPFENGDLTLSPAQFDDDAMIFPEGAGQGLRYGPVDGPGLRFQFQNLPMLALWQKPGAPFICIEPWHAMAAQDGAGPQIQDRPGTILLAPNAGETFSWIVSLD